MKTLDIRSISKTISPLVTAPGFCARMIAVFDNSCDVETQGGEIIALVNPSVGNGPFHLVLQETVRFSEWEVGATVHGNSVMIKVSMASRDRIALRLEGAQIWDPLPDWHKIRSGARVTDNIPILKETLITYAPEESLAGSGRSAWKEAANKAIKGVIELSKRDDQAMLWGELETLCGLGPGLTPSGDDWLAGWLLGLRLTDTEKDIQAIGEKILALAKKRTTSISQAFLQAAARGEAIETWHFLLEKLAHGEAEEVEQAARAVMQFGATSGADMLAGFTEVFE